MKNIYKIIAGSMAAFPLMAGAQDINLLLTNIKGILNTLIVVIIGLAVVVFLFGVFKFITAAGDEKKRAEGRQMIIWGLIGLAVMVSVWGLVGFIITFFGATNTSVNAPSLL